jgi:hypothetical protein
MLAPFLCTSRGNEIQPSKQKGSTISDVSCWIEIRTGNCDRIGPLRVGYCPHVHMHRAICPLAKETPTLDVGVKSSRVAARYASLPRTRGFQFTYRSDDWIPVPDKSEYAVWIHAGSRCVGQNTSALTTTISKQAKDFPQRLHRCVYSILICAGQGKNQSDLSAAIALHRWTNIESLHLMSGSAVRIRHYPVTVSAEN